MEGEYDDGRRRTTDGRRRTTDGLKEWGGGDLVFFFFFELFWLYRKRAREIHANLVAIREREEAVELVGSTTNVSGFGGVAPDGVQQ